MKKKNLRPKSFVSRELSTSIALIILWSLLVTAFFTYFAKELGEKIGSGTLLFVIVMLGYLAIVVVLTMLFSHRLIGPFQRLKTEMRLIRSGDLTRRLNVRTSDDIYIKSFISEVNAILEKFDNIQTNQAATMTGIDSELMDILACVEDEEIKRDRLREQILGMHGKVNLLKTNNVKEDPDISPKN